MLTTKHYLESLPADEQDAILDDVDPDYEAAWAVYEAEHRFFTEGEFVGAFEGEWTDDAENEPTFEDKVNKALHDWIERGNPDAPIDWPEEEPSEPAEEELAEWARALMEEDEQEVDKFTERDESPMVKPAGKCVTLEDKNGVEWKL